MNVSAFWQRLDVPGYDTALFGPSGNGWRVRGTSVFHDERGPVSAVYEVAVDHNFETQSGIVHGFVGTRPYDHEIVRDAYGWVLDGHRVPGLSNLVDLDFGFTPATNLQQLRRVALGIGDRAEFAVAWFDIGEDTLIELPQIYERREARRYWYESPQGDYRATLELADTGFVTLYPSLWQTAMPPEGKLQVFDAAS